MFCLFPRSSPGSVFHVFFSSVSQFLFGLFQVLLFAAFAHDYVDHIVELACDPLWDYITLVTHYFLSEVQQ